MTLGLSADGGEGYHPGREAEAGHREGPGIRLRSWPPDGAGSAPSARSARNQFLDLLVVVRGRHLDLEPDLVARNVGTWPSSRRSWWSNRYRPTSSISWWFSGTSMIGRPDVFGFDPGTLERREDAVGLPRQLAVNRVGLDVLQAGQGGRERTRRATDPNRGTAAPTPSARPSAPWGAPGTRAGRSRLREAGDEHRVVVVHVEVAEDRVHRAVVVQFKFGRPLPRSRATRFADRRCAAGDLAVAARSGKTARAAWGVPFVEFTVEQL